MKSYYGYIRVSTAKQGEHGVSLQEQQAAIEAYASNNNLKISRWFEERETAAKRGRAVFARMMTMLRQKKAEGVVIHKIDRSARNLRDWSDLGEMIDGGIEVHFANESLDLNSRGGRLSADIQAVVAADFIRNLSQEARKGMRGRYKQGLYPLPAPIGYVDRGGGKPKSVEPAQGPLVQKMFELYVSGGYTLFELTGRMYELGLRTKNGQAVKKSVIARMLANPFYYGIVRLKGTGEIFEGRHQPLISQALFRAAREVAAQRLNKKKIKHDFLYRRCLRCASCGYNLGGERSKGIVYYRCHSRTCPTNAIRDDVVTAELLSRFAAFEMPDDERKYLSGLVDEIAQEARQQRDEIISGLQASLGNVQNRTSRLTDAFLDGVLDTQMLQDKQKALLLERNELEGKLRDVQERQNLMVEKLKDFLDFVASIKTIFENAAPAVRQRTLRRVASRITVTNKTVQIVLEKSYQLFTTRLRSKELFGVTAFQTVIPNSSGETNHTANIGGNEKTGAFAAESSSFGSPPQNALRTMLLDIGKELLLDESHNVRSDIE